MHYKSFQDVKDMVSEDCLIQFYDPLKPLYIECDASKQGIGCVMLQPDDNLAPNTVDGIPSNLGLLLMLQKVCLRLSKIMPT